jgi:hypothetical protein
MFKWNPNKPIVPFYEHVILSFEIHPQNALYISQNKHYQIHPLLKRLVFQLTNIVFKIPNLNKGQKDHFIILDKLILTCPL